MSSKLSKFFAGRRGQFSRMRAECAGVNGLVWVHSASYGEFEEIRPVLAALRLLNPECRILVTFFSPSGYEYLKDDPIADFVYYLPFPSRRNAKRFLDIVRPSVMLLAISDYWPPYLKELRRGGVPAYLVSARFVPGMFYFRTLGRPYLNLFRNCFRRIFVKDAQSQELLSGAGVHNAELVGDPRLDRVMEIASQPWSDSLIDAWCAGKKVFVAGSTLPDMDDECIIALVNANPGDKFLLIPHEQGAAQLTHLRDAIDGEVAFYTECKGTVPDAHVLVVDTVGMLSRLYRYGFAAFVGGGFCGLGPHSILEPAAYGIPVSFGPLSGTQKHCGTMVEAGAAVSVDGPEALCGWYASLKSDPGLLVSMGRAAKDYCSSRAGSADVIARQIVTDIADSL